VGVAEGQEDVHSENTCCVVMPNFVIVSPSLSFGEQESTLLCFDIFCGALDSRSLETFVFHGNRNTPPPPDLNRRQIKTKRHGMTTECECCSPHIYGEAEGERQRDREGERERRSRMVVESISKRQNKENRKILHILYLKSISQQAQLMQCEFKYL